MRRLCFVSSIDSSMRFEHAPGHPPVPAAGEADLHALLVELVGAAHEQRLVEVHEVAHLVGRAAPVLGGEGVEGDPLDADLEGAVHHVQQGGLAGTVPLRAGQAPRVGPASVAVHDTGHVDGHLGEIQLGRHGVGSRRVGSRRVGALVRSLGIARIADGRGHPMNLPRPTPPADLSRGAGRVGVDRGAGTLVRTSCRDSGTGDAIVLKCLHPRARRCGAEDRGIRRDHVRARRCTPSRHHGHVRRARCLPRHPRCRTHTGRRHCARRRGTSGADRQLLREHPVVPARTP